MSQSSFVSGTGPPPQANILPHPLHLCSLCSRVNFIKAFFMLVLYFIQLYTLQLQVYYLKLTYKLPKLAFKCKNWSLNAKYLTPKKKRSNAKKHFAFYEIDPWGQNFQTATAVDSGRRLLTHSYGSTHP